MNLIAQHADLLLILACIFGFFMAWGIGANDVANAMGTSVGSGAIRIWQAVLIAGIFEFLGAWLAGGQVTQTISSGLVKSSVFTEQPGVLVLGMLASLLGAGTLLLVTSLRGLPVSTGQSIVGGILGFALAAVGSSHVDWSTVGKIALSWVASPIIAGSVAFVLFESLRTLVLNHRDPSEGARRFAPYYLFLAAFVVALVTLVKGLAHVAVAPSLPVGIASAAGIAFIFAALSKIGLRRFLLSAKTSATDRFRNVERIFGYAQIFTATVMAFAHGSNDVANAIGPVAAVASVIAHPGALTAQTDLAGWVLVLGGLGIVFGLATYGYRVMHTIGRRITQLTPTRGFCAELATAITIILATWFGIPISTTQTLVGAVLGVGLARGMRALDLSVLGTVALGWVLTLPGAALFSAAYFWALRLGFGG
ncbi:inorganic phosphate transporter [Salinisphaera sp. USBA-960]|uniref:inorganic phosphate transporter n=1 Tax=Salinisphaera orenii TaxID=856731 RepID=UPI000DBE6D2F|nr:inorganic phosphate transporter [Salifodinibacter halophilus]NNC25342.1 inorganic phosphate transporter [Salifodinibacter halophilus]